MLLIVFKSISINFFMLVIVFKSISINFFMLHIIFQSISLDFQNHNFLTINVGTIFGKNISINFDEIIEGF